METNRQSGLYSVCLLSTMAFQKVHRFARNLSQYVHFVILQTRHVPVKFGPLGSTCIPR